MKIISLVGVVLITVITVNGQNQRVEVQTSTELVDTTKFSRIVESYNRIIRAQEEKLHLFKVDLIGPALYLASNWEEKDNARNRLINLAYERKFSPNWSWIVEGSFKADREDFREILGGAGIRYYYNMKNRIMKGKSANNFSGNYFGSVFTYGYQYQNETDQSTVKVLYGLQRRLGKRWFIDANIGLEHLFDAFEGKESGTDFYCSFTWGLAF